MGSQTDGDRTPHNSEAFDHSGHENKIEENGQYNDLSILEAILLLRRLIASPANASIVDGLQTELGLLLDEARRRGIARDGHHPRA